MNDDSTEPFDDLVAAFLDGELSDADRLALLARIETCPKTRDALQRQLALADEISRALDPSRSDDAFVDAVRYRLSLAQRETLADFADNLAPRLRKTRLPVRLNWQAWGLGLAAAIAMIIGGHHWLNANDSRAPVATIALSSAIEASTVSLAEGAQVPSNTPISFDSGVLRLDFKNGAIVALQGPATFTIRNALKLELTRGRINAYCPVSAHGFQVLTSQADLTDRGTSFGVDASSPGSSNVLVFNGEVEAASRMNPREKTQLTTGGALSFADGEAPATATFDPHPYATLWPITSGIMATLGDIRPVTPGIPSRLHTFESDDTVIVCPEKRGVRLNKAIDTNPVPDGGLVMDKNPVPVIHLHPNHPLRSYLLHYNPVGKPKNEGYRHFKGSITFDAPILGVIYTTDGLKKSDRIFCHTRTPSSVSMRGLEWHSMEAPPDSMSISADKRTLSIDIYTGPEIDQIRVLLADDPK